MIKKVVILGLLIGILARPSLINAENEAEAASLLLQDYFRWKLDTFKLFYYLTGFNQHAGQLDDLSLESFDRLIIECEHFAQRADKLLMGNDSQLGVRDKRHVKILKWEAEMCVQESKFKVSSERSSVARGALSYF